MSVPYFHQRHTSNLASWYSVCALCCINDLSSFELSQILRLFVALAKTAEAYLSWILSCSPDLLLMTNLPMVFSAVAKACALASTCRVRPDTEALSSSCRVHQVEIWNIKHQLDSTPLWFRTTQGACRLTFSILFTSTCSFSWISLCRQNCGQFCTTVLNCRAASTDKGSHHDT